MKNNSNVQVEIARNLKMLMIQLRSRMDGAILPLGITSSQYTMLAALLDEPEISGAEIARKCRVTPQTVHKMLVAIEAAGWIKREKRPTNEKTFFVRVTPEGQRLIDRSRPARYEVVKSMLKGFSTSEAKSFASFILRCMDNLSEPSKN